MSRRLATLVLRLWRWKMAPDPAPSHRQYVLLADPHTSFWDGLWMLLAARHYRLPVRFVIKAKHLKGPFAPIRWLGAVPVDPGTGQRTTEALCARVTEMRDAGQDFALLIAPSGTRSASDHWRSGFYHLARATDLPVYASYLDYGRRRIGVHPLPLPITGDPVADMEAIRAVYTGVVARHPERQTPVVLREELEDQGPTNSTSTPRSP